MWVEVQPVHGAQVSADNSLLNVCLQGFSSFLDLFAQRHTRAAAVFSRFQPNFPADKNSEYAQRYQGSRSREQRFAGRRSSCEQRAV